MGRGNGLGMATSFLHENFCMEIVVTVPPSRYQLDPHNWRLNQVTYADSVRLSEPPRSSGAPQASWQWQKGWVRTLALVQNQGAPRTAVTYVPFADRTLPLEPRCYFETEDPDPEALVLLLLFLGDDRASKEPGGIRREGEGREASASRPFFMYA